MRSLLDTNILLRSSQPSSPHNATAIAAVAALLTAGRSLCVSSQVIYEFLVVATKPISENGLGMSQSDADVQLGKLLTGIDVLYDSELVATELRRLVVMYQVTGKKIHDARLVAVMTVHAVQALLTFNGADFKRFPNIQVLSPEVTALGMSPIP